MPRAGRARGTPSSFEDPLEDFFVPTASSRGISQADPFERKAPEPAGGIGPPTSETVERQTQEAPDSSKGSQAVPSDVSHGGLKEITPPDGPAPAERGPRERRLENDFSSRTHPGDEVQPFSAEEDAEDDRSEPVTGEKNEKTPLKSCLRNSLRNSGSRTPEAQSQREITPPSSKEASKERQLKSALKQPTSSSSDVPEPTNILEAGCEPRFVHACSMYKRASVGG